MADPSSPETDTPTQRSRKALRLVAWLLIVGGCVWVVGVRGIALSGSMSTLHREIDQAPAAPAMLLVRLPTDDGSQERSVRDADQVLTRVSVTLADALGERRVPLAPPASAVAGWLDAHGMYLLPRAAHPALEARLGRPEMEASVAAIRAQLASPVFGVSGLQPRRDPLDLRGLLLEHRGSLGFVESDTRAIPTGIGDLRARDTDSLLVGLRRDVALDEVMDIARDVATQESVRIDLVGGRAWSAARERHLRTEAPRLLLLLLSVATLGLSIGMRAVSPAVQRVALGVGVVGCALLSTNTVAPLTVPTLVTGWGLVLAAAAWRPRGHLARTGWVCLALCFAPLWLMPQNPWQHWAHTWPFAVALAVMLTRALSPRARDDGESREHTDPRPQHSRRLVSAAVVIVLGAAASLSVQKMKLRASAQVPFGPPALREAGYFTDRHFFVEHNLVSFDVVGGSAVEVLDRAPASIEPLASLLPDRAVQLNSPGSFVLPAASLTHRRRSLRAMRIEDRMVDLKEILTSEGLRAVAFNEFLNAATQLERFPDASTALDSPLADWIGRFIREEDDRAVLTHQLELRRPSVDDLSALTEAGTPRGPAIAGIIERRDIDHQLAVLALVQLWIVGIVSWLGARNLGVALVAATTTGCSWAASLSAAALLGIRLGPQLYPVLLGVAALSAVGALRTLDLTRPGDPPRPRAHTFELLPPALLALSGAALLGTRQPWWAEAGALLALGALLGAAIGRFSARGLLDIFAARPHANTPPTDEGAPPSAPPEAQP